MSENAPERIPGTQSASTGCPPRPPKQTAHGAGDQEPGEGARSVRLPDPVMVKDLAAALGCRPFVIIADLMETGCFPTVHDQIGFERAAAVARRHGFAAVRAD